MVLTEKDIQEEMYKYGDKLGIKRDSTQYPRFTNSPGQQWNYNGIIYIKDEYYHYELYDADRGNFIKEVTTKSIDELLFPVFDNITLSMASTYATKYNDGLNDTRKYMFQKQLELLNKVNSVFAKMEEKEIEKILKKYPYRD